MASVNVAVTATALCTAGGNRSAVVFYNNSDTTIYVAPRSGVTATADANTGIPIIAGGSMSINPSYHGKASLESAWYGIHAGSGNKVMIVEQL